MEVSSAGITRYWPISFAWSQTIVTTLRDLLINVNNRDVGMTMHCNGNRSGASQGGHQLIRDRITVRRPRSWCCRQQRLHGPSSGDCTASEVRSAASLRKPPLRVCFLSVLTGGERELNAASVPLY